MGSPQAHGDPAPLGPKERRTCFLPVYCTAGQKVSPLAGSRDVGAMTVKMLLTLVSQTGPI